MIDSVECLLQKFPLFHDTYIIVNNYTTVGIRDMRQKAKDKERYAATMQMTIKGIEQAASKAYEQDRSEQELHASSSSENRYQKNWVLHKESGYHYNALYGWYYDVQSGMYYGGSPPEWTHKPNIPSAAHYGAVNPQSDPLLQSTVPREDNDKDVSEVHRKYPPGMKVRNVHPMADIGGYQMPLEGTFGTGHTPRVGQQRDQKKARDSAENEKGLPRGSKRKDREGAKEKKVSTKEEEFLAKREAARQRVQKRTMDQFGLS